MKTHEIEHIRVYKLGVTQRELAEMLGFTTGAVGKWTTNENLPSHTKPGPLAVKVLKYLSMLPKEERRKAIEIFKAL